MASMFKTFLVRQCGKNVTMTFKYVATHNIYRNYILYSIVYQGRVQKFRKVGGSTGENERKDLLRMLYAPECKGGLEACPTENF